jgi:hypothetical protein
VVNFQVSTVLILSLLHQGMRLSSLHVGGYGNRNSPFDMLVMIRTAATNSCVMETNIQHKATPCRSTLGIFSSRILTNFAILPYLRKGCFAKHLQGETWNLGHLTPEED